jgi:hypothetical protein
MAIHKRFVLAAYPDGMPREGDFRLEEGPVPRPEPGEFLIRTIYISPEPRLRPMMNPTTPGNAAMRAEHGPTADIGRLMPGTAIGEVLRSRHVSYAEGDIVEGFFGWQTHIVSDGTVHARHNPAGIHKIDRGLGPISAHAGVLGIPGITAYLAIQHEATPGPGETFVVTSAAGAVGSTAGQIAKIMGARVVGLTGSSDKATFLTGELGFDAAINYRRAPDLAAAVRDACPGGVDLYFDNVGGAVAETIIDQLNPGGCLTRIGVIAHYNDDANWAQSQAFDPVFIVHDHVPEYDEARRTLAGLMASGELTARADIINGFENTPAAFIGMLKGENIGKRLVRVSAEP